MHYVIAVLTVVVGAIQLNGYINFTTQDSGHLRKAKGSSKSRHPPKEDQAGRPSVMKHLSNIQGMQLFGVFRRPIYSYVWMISLNVNWVVHQITLRENSLNPKTPLVLICVCCLAIVVLLIALAAHSRLPGGKAFLLQYNEKRTVKARGIELILWVLVCLQVLVWSGIWEKVVWL